MIRVALLFALAATAAAHSARAADAPVSFKRDVAPILVKQCQGCHNAEKSKGQYRLDTFERLMRPGKSKSDPIKPGQPKDSHLYGLIATADDDERMPQKADPLPAGQVALIGRWIEQGATFDGPDAAAPLVSLVPAQEHPAPPATYRFPMPVTALALSPDGKLLAAGGYHEVTLWDPADGKLLGRIPRVAERTYGLAFSPDGRTLAVAGGAPGTLGELRLCDVASRDAGRVLERIGDVMLVVRFSPDGAHLAAGGADNLIRVFAAATGTRELLIEQHADWVSDLAYSPDGAQLASASRDRSARVFDAKTGAKHAAFLAHEEAVSAVAWLPGGKLVATAGRDRKLRTWDATDAKESGKGVGLGADPTRLEAAAGKIYCATADGSVRVYSAASRAPVKALAAPHDNAYCVVVDEKNHRVIAGYHSGKVRTFDAETAEALGEFVASPGYVPKDR
jgi:hypothetical protein